MPKYKKGDAAVTRDGENALCIYGDESGYVFSPAFKVAFAVKPDGFHTDEDHPHPHDIVARLVPDTGAERALRLLRELNDKLEAGVHLSLSWCVTVWECELHEDDGSVDLGEKSPRSVFVACEPTPLAAVEAAAKALGVELGEGE